MVKRILSVLAIISLIFAMGVTFAFASSDGVDLKDAVTQQKNEEALDALDDIVTSSAPDYAFAQSKFGKVSGWVAKAKGAILLIVWLAAGVLTCVDIVYLTLPFTRQYLAPHVGNRGMSTVGGFGGFGGYRGGSPYGGFGQQAPYDNQQTTSNSVLGKQWVSESALDTIRECSPATNNTGFGSATTPATKNKMATYFKKRAFELILIVFVPLILTSQLFYKLGFMLFNWVSNINLSSMF